MKINFYPTLLAVLSLAGMAMLSGCPNTAEGVAEDSAKAGEAISQTAEKTGEAASDAAQRAGQTMAKTADDATKSAAVGGKNIAGALQVTPLVKTAISADTELNDPKNKIDVDSKDGVVHLKGHVTSNSLKAKATKIAEERIKENNGTDKVINQLLVKP